MADAACRRVGVQEWEGRVTPIRLHLPWPPTVNHQYARTRRGGIALSAEARAFREQVWALAKEHCPDVDLSGRRVDLFLWAVPPDKRKRDLDNLLKATLDALTHALGLCDDMQHLRSLYLQAFDDGEVGVEVLIVPREVT